MAHDDTFIARLRAICKRAVAGDVVTAAELKSATMKYVHQYDDPTRVLEQLYFDDDLRLREAVEIVTKRQHAVVEKASGGAHDLAGALLRHLQDRLDRRREAHGFEKRKESNMDRTESLRDIAKTSGIHAIAKAMVDENRSYGLTEVEFTEIATEDAVRKFPDAKTPAAAFSQMFTDNSPYGLTLRRAHAVVRAEQLAKAMPTVISGGDLRDAGDAAEAMDQLHEIGRRMAPTATPEKQFSLAFSANPLLAARAHRRPSRTTFFPATKVMG
jgi:hypothetical protein